MKSPPRVDWRFAALATLVVTCLFTLQSMAGEGAPPLAAAHRHQMMTWIIWLGLTPAIVWTTRRYQLGVRAPVRWLLGHLGLGSLFALASLGLEALLGPLFGWEPRPRPPTLVGQVGIVAGGLLRYSIIAFGYQTIASYRAAREREAVAARLRAELAEARLANLEGRLHPHFLFNTLNSIAVLVRDDPPAAEAMVEQLSEILRASLGSDPQREVSLGEELELVEHYLAIERVRYHDRLHATVDATPDARLGRVPQLILQPLVENAVRHGIAPKESGGSLAVRARVERETLLMTVEDDGLGIGNSPRSTRGSGIGLRSVKARLAHLYGGAERLEVAARTPSGTRITIALPYRPVVS